MHASLHPPTSHRPFTPKRVSSLLLVAALLNGCDNEASPQIPTAVASAISSICDYDRALQDGVTGISKRDAESMCRAMSAKLGHAPSPQLLATMQKFLFGIRANFDFQDSAADFAEQAMGVIEGRRQLDSEDSAMIHTLNVTAKCFSGSQGRVTPRAIAAALRTAGDMAETLSDEGMHSMCAMIDINLGGSM